MECILDSLTLSSLPHSNSVLLLTEVWNLENPFSWFFYFKFLNFFELTVYHKSTSSFIWCPLEENYTHTDIPSPIQSDCTLLIQFYPPFISQNENPPSYRLTACWLLLLVSLYLRSVAVMTPFLSNLPNEVFIQVHYSPGLFSH